MLERISKNITLLKSCIYFIISQILSLFFKKKKNVWVFGEQGGVTYFHNSKFFFEYIVNTHPDIIAVWLTSSKSVKKDLKSNKLNCCLFYTFKAAYYRSIAKVYISSHGSMYDTGGGIIKGAFLFNLWHGMPVKKIGLKTNSESVRLVHRLNNWLNSSKAKFDFMTVSSDFFVPVFNECSDNNKLIKVFGQSTDAYITKQRDKVGVLKDLGIDNYMGQRIVTYFPTFRDTDTQQQHIPFKNKKIPEIENAIILYKFHPKVKARFNIALDSKIHIIESNISTYDLLSITDILITDYSSIYIDFLLQKKPIIFYCYDQESYQEERGFLFDFEAYTPGNIVKTEEQLLSEICDQLNGGYKCDSKYLKCLEIFHKHTDGKSNERIYNAIQETINLSCDD